MLTEDTTRGGPAGLHEHLLTGAEAEAQRGCEGRQVCLLLVQCPLLGPSRPWDQPARHVLSPGAPLGFSTGALGGMVPGTDPRPFGDKAQLVEREGVTQRPTYRVNLEAEGTGRPMTSMAPR